MMDRYLVVEGLDPFVDLLGFFFAWLIGKLDVDTCER
jgi:hypothetical protein